MSDAAAAGVHEGGCLCGAVRYRATGVPRSVNACFCTMCLKQTGSALPAFATWPLASFTVVRGALGEYRASPKAVRRFCTSCGSPVTWQADGEDEVDVFLGTLDAPADLGGPSFALWAEHRPAWLPPLGIVEHPRSRT